MLFQIIKALDEAFPSTTNRAACLLGYEATTNHENEEFVEGLVVAWANFELAI